MAIFIDNNTVLSYNQTMKNKDFEQKLNEVFDILNASEVERTSIRNDLILGHHTFEEITPETVQARIDYVAVQL